MALPHNARLLLTLVVLLAVVGGWIRSGSGVSMHTGMVYSAGTISSEPIDGWTYGIPVDVAWTDVNGSWHDHGRPDCLPASAGQVGPITFTSVDAAVGGVSWRP